jgi:hypothetical protein
MTRLIGVYQPLKFWNASWTVENKIEKENALLTNTSTNHEINWCFVYNISYDTSGDISSIPLCIYCMVVTCF